MKLIFSLLESIWSRPGHNLQLNCRPGSVVRSSIYAHTKLKYGMCCYTTLASQTVQEYGLLWSIVSTGVWYTLVQSSSSTVYCHWIPLSLQSPTLQLVRIYSLVYSSFWQCIYVLLTQAPLTCKPLHVSPLPNRAIPFSRKVPKGTGTLGMKGGWGGGSVVYAMSWFWAD